MDNDNVKRWKAKNLRYKKAAMETLSFDAIKEELYNIVNECAEIQWFMSDTETLLNALDGDTEEEFEFRMMFAELEAKCDRLHDLFYTSYVTKHFDDMMVGILGNRYKVVGYDFYEEDYFGLTTFEAELAQTESGKLLMRLTKEQLISIWGQCLGIVISFLDIRHKYDYLKATFDILRDRNTSILKLVKDIDEVYEKAIEDKPWGEHSRLLDNLIAALPDQIWIE